MIFPVTEDQIISIVNASVPIDHKADRTFVLSIWHQFVPLLNEAYAAGKRETMKEVKKDGVQA